MTTKLKNLVITKVALCDEGACSEAHIQLYKRRNEGGNTMTFEEIMNGLTPTQQAVVKAKMTEEMKAAADKKETEMKDKLTTMEADNTKLKEDMKKMKTTEEPNEEDILKSVDPAVRALIEKSRLQAQAAEEAVKKMKEEQVNNEAIAKAKTLPSIGDVNELTELYKSLQAMDPALCKKTFDILEKSEAVIAKSSVFTEVGSSGAGTPEAGADAWSQIEKAAMEVAKTRSIAKSKAISVVMEEQPELYQAYIAEQDNM